MSMQFVYFHDKPWYGAELCGKILEDYVHLINLKRVISAAADPAIFFSFLSSRNYPDIFEALRRANIPYYAKDREDRHPIVIAGGGAMSNPEPIAHMVDIFCVGDGEEFLLQSIPILIGPGNRESKIDQLSKLPGAYLPGTDIDTKQGFFLTQHREPIKPAICSVWAPPPGSEIELARGCPGKCFFCDISWTRPYNERPITDAAKYQIKRAWAPSFSNLSYFGIARKIYAMNANGDMRVDTYLREEALPPSVKARGYTFGIEGITPRLRKLVGKPITDDMLNQLIERIIYENVKRLQLYFIRGLPTENIEDWKEFRAWLYPVLDICNKHKIGLEIQFTPLTRTPHTPMQYLEHKYNYESEAEALSLVELAREMKKNDPGNMLYITHSRLAASWLIDTVLNCGGRNTDTFLLAIHRGKISGYQSRDFVGSGLYEVEHIIEGCGIDPATFINKWKVDEILPWSHIKTLDEAGEKARLSALRFMNKEINEYNTRRQQS